MSQDPAARRQLARRARALLLIAAAAVLVLFEPVFLSVSLLAFDNRQLAPWVIDAPPAAAAPRPMNFVTSDINGWIMPDAALALAQIRSGEAPIWNPHQYLGQPLLANLAFAVFYVTLPIALWLGPVRGYAVALLLHLIVFGAGSFRFLLRRGLRPKCAAFGAIAAMFSGFVGAHVHLPMYVHVSAYFPWLLLGAEWLVERAHRRAVAALALCVGLSLLAGFPQISVIQLVATMAYAAGHESGRGRAGIRLRPGCCFAVAIVLGVALSAVQLLPATELLRHSLRREPLARARLVAKALEPQLLAGFVVPHLFQDPITPVAGGEQPQGESAELPTAQRWLGHDTAGKLDVQNNFVENTVYAGLLVLVLALLGAWRRGRARAFTAMAVVALLVAAGAPGFIDVARAVPGFAAGSPKRILALSSAAIAYLAAFGLEAFLERPSRGRCVVLVVMSLVYLSVAAATWWILPARFESGASALRHAIAWDVIALAAAGCALLVVAVLVRFRAGGAEHAANLLLVLTLLDLGLFLRRTNPFQPLLGQYQCTPAIEFLQQKLAMGERRMARIGRPDHLPATIAQMFGLSSVDGTASMVVARVGELLTAIDPGVLDPKDPRVASGFAGADQVAVPLLDALGVSHVLKGVAPLAPGSGLALDYAGHREVIGIYARARSLPRVFLATELVTIQEAARRLGVLTARDFDPLCAILEVETQGLGPVLGKGTCEFTRPRACELEIDVNVDAPALVVIAETAMPGWRAQVDGIFARVLTVDHALMGVGVPRGAHHLQLVYDPASYRLGLWCSSISALVIALALVWPVSGKTAPGSHRHG
ncbi:MAG: hypothetical protein U1E76_08755 [Planctomycetota bacterium]